VDIGLARHGGRVAKVLRGLADRGGHVPLLLPVGGSLPEGPQRPVGQHGPGPGPEVLGGDAGRDLGEVAVDVVRRDIVRLAVRIDILEELLAREVSATPDDGCQASVPQPDLVLLAGLAAEAERDRGAVDGRVPVAQGGQPERAVEPRVLIVPDPDQGELEQPDDGCQHFLAGQIRPSEILVDLRPDRRKDPGKGDQPGELGVVSAAPIPGVVAVDLATARVPTGRLEVAVRPRADPHLRPGRRDGDRPDPGEGLRVADPPAVGVTVREAATGASSDDPGLLVAGMAEPGQRPRVVVHRGSSISDAASGSDRLGRG